jgi:hypothetical protein
MLKKMFVSEVKNEIVKYCLTSNYLHAMLREDKSGWLIEYYVENPATKKLERGKANARCRFIVVKREM